MSDTPDHHQAGLQANGPSAKDVWRATKFLVAGLAVSWFIAWPVGSTWIHIEQTGRFGLRLGYTFEFFLLAVFTTLLTLALGYALSVGVKLEASAKLLERSFAGLGNLRLPQSENAKSQVSALNAEIDRALERLAAAESLIRQQVRALDSAGTAIESGALRGTERLASERQALMEATEDMNREAESFAETIAEQTKLVSSERDLAEQRLDEKEKELKSQLQRLESVSATSLERYESLATTMEGRSASIDAASAEATERHAAITSQIEENTERLATAQSDLAEQTARLESLMKDQRKRADRLAKIITEQSSKLSTQSIANTSQAGDQRRRLPWKDILATVEDAMPRSAATVPPAAAPATPFAQAPAPSPAPAPAAPTPAAAAPSPVVPSTLSPFADELIEAAPAPEPAPTPKPDAMDRLIERIQSFALTMRTQLFDIPSRDEMHRFEQGERQIFARELLSHDANDLKRRIAEEIQQNDVFKTKVTEFLRDFDTILEPLSTEDGGESVIESYLTSPIGRLYVLTGSAVGHFS